MKQIGTCALVLLAALAAAVQGQDGDSSDALRKAMSRKAEPLEFLTTIYPGKGASPESPKPLCVILASRDFPVSGKDYWIQTFYKCGCPTLVLKLKPSQPDSRWEDASVREVLKQVSSVPKRLGADTDKLVVVADEATAPLAYRMVNGVNARMAGLVLVSAKPMVRPVGLVAVPWRPVGKEWLIPMWIVCGTRERDAGVRLVLWRKFVAASPTAASVTIDSRMARGLGPILPGNHFPSWLNVIASGKRPGVGGDTQALTEKQAHAAQGKAMIKALKETPAARKDRVCAKQEGPFAISVAAPKNWARVTRQEREYNPKGVDYDDKGGRIAVEPNPYSEMYLRPEQARNCFSRIFVRKWSESAAELLANTNRRLGSKGYLVVPLGQVKQGEWVYQPTVVLQLYGDKWHRWITLMAAKGGSKTNPAGTMVMLMDTSGRPDPADMTASLKCICDSLKVDYAGK